MQEKQKAGNLANQSAVKQEPPRESISTAVLFDVNQEPTRKDTYWIAEDEFEILEDVKRELRRKFDLKVTKSELVRCAIHLLNSLYQKEGEASDIVQRFKRKKCAEIQKTRKQESRKLENQQTSISENQHSG